MEIETKTPDIEIQDLKDELDIEIEVPEIELEPTSNEVEVELGGSVVQDDYEKLKNIPSINGNKLIGNKTTEELGIVGTSMTEIELSTDITNPTEILDYIGKSGTYVAKNTGVLGNEGEPMVALGKGQFFSVHNLKDYANELGLGDNVSDRDNFIDVDVRLITGEYITVRIYGTGNVDQLVWLNNENVSDYVKVNVNLSDFIYSNYGISTIGGKLAINSASYYDIDNGTDNYKPVTSNTVLYAVESKGKNYFPTKTEFNTLETNVNALKTEIETILESVVSIDE